LREAVESVPVVPIFSLRDSYMDAPTLPAGYLLARSGSCLSAESPGPPTGQWGVVSVLL